LWRSEFGGKVHGRAPAEGGGRGVFNTEVRRAAVQGILSGEKRLTKLSRELAISPSVIQNGKQFVEAGGTTTVQASEKS
jgi:transposase-like protein